LERELAGSSIGKDEVRAKLTSNYSTTGAVKAGQFRIMKLVHVKNEYFALGDGFRIEPGLPNTASSERERRPEFRLPNTVNALESELRAYMAANQPLPSDCPGNSLLYREKTADRWEQLLFFQPETETRDQCEPRDTSDERSE